MKKQHLLAQSQELFSPQNAYHKFIECMKYFVGPRPVGAVEEVQKYLDKIIVLETDLYENSLHDILLNYSENIIAIKFFLMSYLSVVASRVFRFDEKGNETKIGEFLMEDAQKLLPKLKTFIQNDHVLHLKLSHIYCQIRLLNLNLDTNMETIDELFREARVWKEKCGKTRECMYFKTLLGALFTNLSFRADRWHDADLMACQIWEDFSENDDVKALKYDPGISLELAQICQFHFEKAALVHNTEDEIRYRKKALWYFKNAIGKIETTEAKCRFSQRSAVQALHEEKTVLGCVKARTHRKALKHINQSHLGWKKMIRESQNNLKHSRYFSHLVYYNYLKYQIKPDLKYFKNMEAVFAELSSKILGSPEVDNLEIIEAMLRMTCQMKSFSRAVEICSNSKKIRNHDKLMYPFGPILKLVEQISLLKTFPDGIVLNKPLSQNEFEKTILQLKKSKNPICSFWYDFGINVYFDFLQKSGESLKYEQMWNFANKIKHFSMETLCSWQSSNSCLKNSSVATVTEILEVPVTDMVFDLLVFAEVSIHSEILSSTYSLMSNSATRFNVPSDKFRFLTNEKLLFQELDDYVWSNCEAQLVLIVQASGQKDNIRSVEEIKQWIAMNARSTKFTWIIVQNIFLSTGQDPDIIQGQSTIRYRPSHEDGREIIVTSSSTKVEKGKFDKTLNRKYLPDALAHVLKEEVARLTDEDRIGTSRCGETSICVQDLCAKMREECCLNRNDYLSADPVQETLNTKELRITLPVLFVN